MLLGIVMAMATLPKALPFPWPLPLYGRFTRAVNPDRSSRYITTGGVKDSHKLDISGIFPPIPTPFTAHGLQIDYAALRNNFSHWNQIPFAGKKTKGTPSFATCHIVKWAGMGKRESHDIHGKLSRPETDPILILFLYFLHFTALGRERKLLFPAATEPFLFHVWGMTSYFQKRSTHFQHLTVWLKLNAKLRKKGN